MEENITCVLVTAEYVICNGTHFVVKENPLTYTDPAFWFYFGVYTMLTLGAGLMSGLTLGLLSLDTLSLEVLIKAGQGKEAAYAKRLLPLIKQHHLLLVTLLLGNAACVESMPIFLDRISDPVTAILVSVSAVLFFGEIIPQAICKKYGLAVGYYTLPLVYFLMGIAFVLAWPVSKLLDCVFGHDSSTYYKRGQLKALVDLHGPQGPLAFNSSMHLHQTTPSGFSYNASNNLGVMLGQNTSHSELYQSQHYDRSDNSGRQGNGGYNYTEAAEPTLELPDRTSKHIDAMRDVLTQDEVMIIKGALDLTNKVARDAMVPLNRVFMLSSSDHLDREKIMKILCYAHSRIPVFMDQDRRMIQGILITKMTILLNPDDSTSLQAIMQDNKCFRPIPYVTETTPLYDLLNIFQTGRTGHMAVVVKDDIDEKQLDALENLYEHRTEGLMVTVPPPVIGIITLEDVIEQLLQEPIEDESDIHRQRVCRRLIDKQQKRAENKRRASINNAELLSQTNAIGEASSHSIAALELISSSPPNGSNGELRQSKTDRSKMPQTDASCVNLLNHYLDHEKPTHSDMDEVTPLISSGKRANFRDYLGV